MRLILFFLLLLSCSMVTLAQGPGASRSFTQTELKRVLNNAFNRLVSSNPNAGEVANYATLDPVNASFSLKSSIPIQPGLRARQRNMRFEDKIRDNSSRISYLSLDISGNLIDKNYGALFTNSALNAGISLGLKYNFTIGAPEVKYYSEDLTLFALKRDLLFSRHLNRRIQIESSMNRTETAKAREQLELSRIATLVKLEKKQTETDLVQKSVDSLGASIASRPGLVDTLQKLAQEKSALQKSLDATVFSLDSIRFLGNGASDLAILELTSDRVKLKKEYDALVASIPLKTLKITWFTLLGGYSRKSYKTFDASLPFDSQIGKGKLNASQLGVAVNHLKQDSLKNHTLFLHLGLFRTRNNNLSLLSTTSIDQVRTITNPAGDVTRTISSKQTVYTDPVKTFNLWNLTAHAYYIFGKNVPTGFHLQPSVNFQDDKHTVTYLTFGYMAAFQNTAKDQPVINAELYIRFNDVFNNYDAETKFLNRNEIGVSFTVPFRFL